MSARSVLTTLVIVTALSDGGIGSSARADAHVPAASARSDYLITNPCGKDQEHPRRFIIACADAGFGLERLRWHGWNHASATARGRVFYNDCDPFCAAGHFHRAPVRVEAFHARRCGDGRRHYRRLRLHYPDRLPPGSRRTETVRLNCG